MSMNLSDRGELLHLLALLVLIAIVVPFVIYAVPGIVGANGSYVVLSGSMEPSISPGDVVIVGETDPATIEEGDVITYTRSDAETPTTHRVVEVLEQDGTIAFRTQGDANDAPDASPVTADQVHGEVILTIPYIGHVISFVNTPYGFVTLVVAPFAFLLLSELYALLNSGRGRSTADVETAPDDETVAPAAIDDSDTLTDVSVGGSVDAQLPSDEETKTPGESTSVDQADGNRTIVNPSKIPVNERGASPGSASSDESTAERTDDDTIAIMRSDLRLSLALLVGFTLYAVWVVMHIQEAWTFTVAFASGMGVVLVGGMYYLAGSQTPTNTQNAHSEPDVRVGDGGTAPSPDSMPVVDRTPGRERHGDSNESDVTPDSVKASKTMNETGQQADRTGLKDDGK